MDFDGQIAFLSVTRLHNSTVQHNCKPAIRVIGKTIMLLDCQASITLPELKSFVTKTLGIRTKSRFPSAIGLFYTLPSLSLPLWCFLLVWDSLLDISRKSNAIVCVNQTVPHRCTRPIGSSRTGTSNLR